MAFVHLWTHAEDGWMLGIPSAAAGIVYEGTTLGDVLALDERDGHVRWHAALGALRTRSAGVAAREPTKRFQGFARERPRTPAVGLVLKNSRYYMLDERDGRILWRGRHDDRGAALS